MVADWSHLLPGGFEQRRPGAGVVEIIKGINWAIRLLLALWFFRRRDREQKMVLGVPFGAE